MTPDRLLTKALADDPARPLITFYDDATGERTELSVLTFANWVAKTANLLVDGLGAQPGQRVALDLPAHWQGAVWHAACWAAGLVTVTGPAAQQAGPADIAKIAVLAVTPDGTGSDRDVPDAEDVVGLGLGPLGLPRPGTQLPAYVTLDYDREIHGFGDRFRSPWGGDAPERPALVTNGTLYSAGELASATSSLVRRWSLPRGARILSVLPYDDLPAIVAGLLAPLANGGGTVLCRHAQPDLLAARAETEHVTAVTGLVEALLPGLPRLT
jgi:uncharacterized protein (TIGR03089 family)